MAEMADNGYIEITKDERMKPIQISKLSYLQIPRFDNTHGANELDVVFISTHGIVDSEYEWLKFKSGAEIVMSPPYWIMCKYESRIAGI